MFRAFRGSLLPLEDQVRVVKAAVQSTLLWSAQSRPSTCRDFVRMQTFMDKCWRYIAHTNLWSMKRSGTNMQTIRERLGVHWLRHEVERRAWEWCGHVLRMSPSSPPRMTWLDPTRRRSGGTGHGPPHACAALGRTGGAHGADRCRNVRKHPAARSSRPHTVAGAGVSIARARPRGRPDKRTATSPFQHVCAECGKRLKSARGLVFHSNHLHRRAFAWPCNRDG